MAILDSITLSFHWNSPVWGRIAQPEQMGIQMNVFLLKIISLTTSLFINPACAFRFIWIDLENIHCPGIVVVSIIPATWKANIGALLKPRDSRSV
jgi:hypothetical protein